MGNLDWAELSKDFYMLAIGFFIGYFTYVLAVRKRKTESKPLLSLYYSLSSSQQPEYLEILALNTGRNSINLLNAGIKYSNGRSVSYSDWDLPKKLEDAEFYTLKASVPTIRQIMLEDNVDVTSAWIQEVEGKLFEVPIPETIKEKIHEKFQ
jgi:hypothetical protein